ncbi:MAG: hypothetical protein M1827_003610 [Pycnora praestabilis]|nr:MAG: hypothetical protein M1827_003610 [Pycnora praestabilis]
MTIILTTVVQTVLIPAFISLALYLIITYLILPFVRQHRHRYNQYLPVNRLATHTTSLRQRISDILASSLLPSSWRRNRNSRSIVDGSHGAGEDDGSLFDEEEGEGMVGFDIDVSRRAALQRGDIGIVDGERRLSRDLEEGFRDDSDDENRDGGVARGSRRQQSQ